MQCHICEKGFITETEAFGLPDTDTTLMKKVFCSNVMCNYNAEIFIDLQ